MADGWFPRVAPDGLHLATGSAQITLYDVAPATGATSNPRTYGVGNHPVWLDAATLLWSNSGSGAAARLRRLLAPFTTPSDLIAVESTVHDAGGGVIAVYTAAPPFATRVYNAAGVLQATVSAQGGPSVDSNGRYSTLARTDDGVYVSGVGRVANESALFEPRLGTGGVVWSKLSAPRRTHGWRAGNVVEDVSVFAVNEFNPVVVDTPAGPWVLLYTESGAAPGLYLHPWGNTHTLFVAAGGTNAVAYPHAVWHASGRFLCAWSSGATLHTASVAVNVFDPLYAIATGAGTGPQPGGTPVTAPSVTPTDKQVEDAKLAAARAAKRQYPHVTDIKDLPTQQTVRLLWDRVFDIAEQLNGTAPSALKASHDALESNLAAFQKSNAAQLEQLTATTTGTPLAAHALPGGGGSGSSGGSGSPGGGQGGGSDGSGDGGIANSLSTVVAARATWDAKVGIERAGRIVNQVAWDLRSQGVGLVDKPGGTNYRGFSIDVVMLTNGVAYDVLNDAEGAANPQWNRIAPIDAGRWRAPVDPTSF